MNQRFHLRGALGCALLLAAALVGLSACRPRDTSTVSLQARLIWGTNDKNTNTLHHAVEPALAADLQETFKWTNYYEMTNQAAVIPFNETGTLQLSAKSVLKVRNLGANRIEINCIGKGKQVSKGVHDLLPGQRVTLGGNTTNGSAWFIVLESTQAPTSAAAQVTDQK